MIKSLEVCHVSESRIPLKLQELFSEYQILKQTTRAYFHEQFYDSNNAVDKCNIKHNSLFLAPFHALCIYLLFSQTSCYGTTFEDSQEGGSSVTNDAQPRNCSRSEVGLINSAIIVICTSPARWRCRKMDYYL